MPKFATTLAATLLICASASSQSSCLVSATDAATNPQAFWRHWTSIGGKPHMSLDTARAIGSVIDGDVQEVARMRELYPSGWFRLYQFAIGVVSKTDNRDNLSALVAAVPRSSINANQRASLASRLAYAGAYDLARIYQPEIASQLDAYQAPLTLILKAAETDIQEALRWFAERGASFEYIQLALDHFVAQGDHASAAAILSTPEVKSRLSEASQSDINSLAPILKSVEIVLGEDAARQRTIAVLEVLASSSSFKTLTWVFLRNIGVAGCRSCVSAAAQWISSKRESAGAQTLARELSASRILRAAVDSSYHSDLGDIGTSEFNQLLGAFLALGGEVAILEELINRSDGIQIRNELAIKLRMLVDPPDAKRLDALFQLVGPLGKNELVYWDVVVEAATYLSAANDAHRRFLRETLYRETTDLCNE